MAFRVFSWGAQTPMFCKRPVMVRHQTWNGESTSKSFQSSCVKNPGGLVRICCLADVSATSAAALAAMRLLTASVTTWAKSPKIDSAAFISSTASSSDRSRMTPILVAMLRARGSSSRAAPSTPRSSKACRPSICWISALAVAIGSTTTRTDVSTHTHTHTHARVRSHV